MRRLLPPLSALVLPILWVWQATGPGRGAPAAFGPKSNDLVGHLWAIWSATQGPLTRSRLARWPDEIDLLPVLGGWLDVFLGSLLAPSLGLLPAYDVVMGLYLVVAGLGGYALARVAGASRGAAVVAGLLLQLDGFVLDHLREGRTEQVGLGFVALAVAGALHLWRRPTGRGIAVAVGVAAAAVVYVSWELAATSLLMAAWTAPWLLASPRAPTAVRRLALAAGTALVVAGPWVATFVVRAAAVRAADESAFSTELAAVMSVPLLGWFGPGTIRPAWLALAALPLAVLVGPRDRRTLRLGIALGLLLALVLAMGPSPRLWGRADPQAPGWGPFLWLQQLPLLGWFHWPDRLLCAWSLAAPPAAALVLDALRRRLPRGAGAVLAVLLAAAMVGDAAWEAAWTHRWPSGGYRLPTSPVLVGLASDPRPGALLDLPPRTPARPEIDYTSGQLVHGRPIRFHLIPDRLTGVDQQAFVDRIALVAWLFQAADQPGRQAPSPAGAPPLSEADVAWLTESGFGFISFSRRGLDPRIADAATRALEARLGPPTRTAGPQWSLWALPSP